MARKHFDEYFNQISKQYAQLQSTLEDISKEVDAGMFEPERLDNLKATILPVKNSYETLNYIRYLLDMPTRKEKQSKYNRQNKKFLQTVSSKTKEAVLAKNQEVIDELKHT